ncbi:MAG: response regulator [Bacteroidales bacterium]|nr:response regulator [Bacteroidales bacterium]
MHILVVDDNIMDRKYLKYVLENHLHYTPKMAKDGQEAINKLKNSHFDLVITDIVMPNVDGFELIQYIKSNCPSTSIVAITGKNQCFLQIVNKLGVPKTFTKPVEPSRLVEHINHLFKSLSKSACA